MLAGVAASLIDAPAHASSPRNTEATAANDPSIGGVSRNVELRGPMSGMSPGS